MSADVKSGKKRNLFQVVLYTEGQDEDIVSKEVLARIARGCFLIQESVDNGQKLTRYKMDRETTIAFLNSLPYEREMFQIERPLDLPEQNKTLHSMTVALLNSILGAFSGPDASERWKSCCDENGFVYSTEVFE